MCVICYKPCGVDLPDQATVFDMFDYNPDYCGLMYIRNKKVYGFKGFSCPESIIDFLNIQGISKGDALALHFRIATAGNVDRQTAHPFPISKKDKELKKLRFVSDYGFMHNGIIGQGKGSLSDTMLFIKEELSKLDFSLGENIDKLDVYAKKFNSRFLLMRYDGLVKMAGNFTELNGLFFSNLNFLGISRPGRKDRYEESFEDRYGDIYSDVYDHNNRLCWKTEDNVLK